MLQNITIENTQLASLCDAFQQQEKQTVINKL